MTLKQAQIITAMVTPFTSDDRVDPESLQTLLEYLLDHGTQGILINGTTGEGPNLTNEEKMFMVKHTLALVNKRVPVIVGAGSNSTKASIENVQELAAFSGIAALLVVVPYYNKPDQAGMIAHFTAVADASKFPIIIYNIPGRTGVKMEVETVLKLAEHPNIVGIKNCTGANDLSLLIENSPADFLVYSGEDEDALVVKTIGGAGIISVASHLLGEQIAQMYDKVDAGEIKDAGQIMRRLTPKIAALFSLPSPAPVKALLNLRGILVGQPRLPILPANTVQQQTLVKIVEQKY
ncbi:4-hydroxy-tetrahydrodipicolinate synthase [Ligilactobacillus salitolerans]|uniref:4-hydroxy-tetrahydrodipicolinate synthase n=1 Tax=Ligilactobacillus salitolerans TaxID=1808352 RepID=UPI003F7612B4